MSKHTATPWVFNDLEFKIKGTGDIEGRTVIANLSPKMDYSRGSGTQFANASRIVSCVNALAGKGNPERWVKEADLMLDKVIAFEHPEMSLGKDKLDFILKLASQRDELLATLKDSLGYVSYSARNRYLAIIKKAEEL
jgi:hypothetical protein